MTPETWAALLAKGVQWRPGMLAHSGISMRLDWLDEEGRWNGAYTHARGGRRNGWLRVGDMSDWLPDLTDPATVGCLIAELRRVSGGPLVVLVPTDSTAEAWSAIGGRRHHLTVRATTEGEAVIAALCAVLGVPS